MKTRTRVVSLALCCIAAISLLSAAFAQAPGDAQRKAAAQVVSPQTPAESPAELGERVQALEKENVVLREDLGKARLDARTRLDEAAKQQAEMEEQLRQRIEELNAKLAAERQSRARSNRNLWLAVGILAIGIIAAD
ncbi:MAG: hypothetical protein JSV79_07535 [Armatimonadota bacterium]|nr:MAG: hypothetical protein JSV79_07535 [Armatimonadota bacterium]